MNNGKIFEWLGKNWRGVLALLGIGLFGVICLQFCQSNAELLVVKDNKVINKTRNR